MSGITQALFGGFGGTARTFEYVTTTAVTISSVSSYTFSAVSIGAAVATRKIVVAVGASASVSRSISSVTLGGNAMTLIVAATSANPLGIYTIDVAAGTTADVVVTFSGSMSRCRVSVYRFTGTWSTLDSASDATPSSGVFSVTSNTASGGALVAVAASFAGAAPTLDSAVGWTVDDETTSGTNRLAVGSSYATDTATGATQSATFSASSTGALAVATFQ